MSVKESFVKITEEVVPLPSSISLPNSLVTAGVVISPSGPLEPTLVESQAELLKLYTSVGAILPSDHITLIQAYRLLATGSVMLVRSSNSDKVKALSPTGDYLIWDYSNEAVDALETSPGFVLVPRYGNAINNIEISLSINTSGSFNLIYNSVTYECSLNQFATNEFGQGIYIEYINNLNFPFKVEVLNATNTTVGAFTGRLFGAGVGYSATDSMALAPMTEALNKLFGQELDLVDMIYDFGFVNQAFQSTMLSVAESNSAEAIMSLPKDAIDPTVIIAYRIAGGIDSDRSYWPQPWDSSNLVTGFKTWFPAGTLYIERIATNKSSSIEFAPAFGKNNGRVRAVRLRKRFTKPEREALLAYQVNTIVEDKGIFYLNDNFTGKRRKDVLSEEQNRRLSNRISRDAAYLMRDFIGEQNTTGTRRRVVDLIEKYLNDFIFNQYYRPDEFVIICDESNNTPEMIRANKLQIAIKIRHRNAIKFIDVLNKAYAIGQNF